MHRTYTYDHELLAHAITKVRLDIQPLLIHLRRRQEQGHSDTTVEELLQAGLHKVSDPFSHIKNMDRVLGHDIHHTNKAHLARILGVSRQSIYNWTSCGYLILTPDGRRVIIRSTLHLWHMLYRSIGHIWAK